MEAIGTLNNHALVPLGSMLIRAQAIFAFQFLLV